MKKIVFMATGYKQYRSLIDLFIESEIELSLFNEYSKELLQTLLKKEIDLFIIEACNKEDLEGRVLPIVQYIQHLSKKQKYLIMTQDDSITDGRTIFEYQYFIHNATSILEKYDIKVYCRLKEELVENDENKHIVIIDDDWLSANVLKTILSSKYQDITIFTSALEGLRAIDKKIDHNEKVDVIFLDLMMPVMNGFKFLEKQSSRFKMADIPVFITTSRNDKEAVIKAFQHNVKEYIIKPYNKEIILDKLEKVFYERK